MRHRHAGRKFGRNSSHRRAMFRNLAGNLILHERIQTTDAKAKELRRVAERLVTKAIRLGEDLTANVEELSEAERQRVLARRVHAHRLVSRFLPKKLVKTVGKDKFEVVDLVRKLFQEIAPRYLRREIGQGGYIRIRKLQNRRGDNAPMSMVEFIKVAAAEN